MKDTSSVAIGFEKHMASDSDHQCMIKIGTITRPDIPAALPTVVYKRHNVHSMDSELKREKLLDDLEDRTQEMLAKEREQDKEALARLQRILDDGRCRLRDRKRRKVRIVLDESAGN